MPDAPPALQSEGLSLDSIDFCCFHLFYLITTVYYDVTNYNAGRSPVINSVFGLILTLTGVPFFPYFRKKYGKKVKG
jgi:APA family basic amino acid/polyamine antiporter